MNKRTWMVMVLALVMMACGDGMTSGDDGWVHDIRITKENCDSMGLVPACTVNVKVIGEKGRPLYVKTSAIEPNQFWRFNLSQTGVEEWIDLAETPRYWVKVCEIHMQDDGFFEWDKGCRTASIAIP